MPIKLIKAMAINPVSIKVIPKPLKGAGIFEYRNFSRMADNATIARNQPTPEPNPKTVASPNVAYSLSCINNAPPKIEQLTAISGKKMPKDVYNAGAYFSTIISTSCTMEAMVAMNMIKLRKLKSIEAKSDDNQPRAPAFNTYFSNI